MALNIGLKKTIRKIAKPPLFAMDNVQPAVRETLRTFLALLRGRPHEKEKECQPLNSFHHEFILEFRR
jgi:hypothetical protein